LHTYKNTFRTSVSVAFASVLVMRWKYHIFDYMEYIFEERFFCHSLNKNKILRIRL